MITYKAKEKSGSEIVYLDGKIAGEIKPIDGMFQYFPKGQKEGGAQWSNLRHCKWDIERSTIEGI